MQFKAPLLSCKTASANDRSRAYAANKGLRLLKLKLKLPFKGWGTLLHNNALLKINTASEVPSCRDLFNHLDEDGSGGISLEELSQGLAKQGYTVTPIEVEQLMGRLDLDADGHIQIDEFAASMIDWRDVSSTCTPLACMICKTKSHRGHGHPICCPVCLAWQEPVVCKSQSCCQCPLSL